MSARAETPHPHSTRVSGATSLQRGLLFAVLLYPYHVLPLVVDTVFVGVAAAIVLCLSAIRLKVPKVGLAASIFIVGIGIWSFVSIARTEHAGPIISQANHLWQFAALVLAFVPVVRGVDWTDTFQSKRFFWLSAFSSLATLTYSLATYGFMFEYTLNVVITMALINQNKTVGITHKILIGSIIILSIFLSPRSTALFIFLTYFIALTLNPSQLIVKLASLSVVFLPIALYLSIDNNTTAALIGYDYNTYIRSEFIRAAWGLLKDKLVFGVGFGPEFRPRAFNYMTTHPLLNDPNAILLVSNHHSIFDTAYRLGIPMAGVLMYVLFVSPKLSSEDKMGKFFMLALAFGMSINAWFEDQAQVVMVAMLSVFLITRARTWLPNLQD
ncbi:hypothetical protein GGR20_003440 [Devosia subaequoris]|uniref:O-antigen ligase family protein n=1 Tax=Devosia subaequoris TaxID=395930 RepID=A0A7W6IQ80_9HYPH|nr:hypothetical protein [Devosia subaequoris]MBB4053778.1 hypothetical protein [Devosia subaequoris]MCP1211025.1 hypothetical protein [Devosia subaequoris]